METIEKIKKPTNFSEYFDKMSIEDRIKMDFILEKSPKYWSIEDNNFMMKMSRKNITLYLGNDGSVYTRQELIDMGIDIDSLKSKNKNPDFTPDIKNIISQYKSILTLSKSMSNKYKEEYDFTKVINPMIDSIDNAIYNLEKIL